MAFKELADEWPARVARGKRSHICLQLLEALRSDAAADLLFRQQLLVNEAG